MKPVNYDNLTPQERRAVRNKYIEFQGGLCAHCGAPLDKEPSPDVLALEVDAKRFPSGFFYWPVHLHHDHKTGMTIGAVHNHCNAVLWQYHGE